MRLLALVSSPYDTIPGQRFRIEQWEPLLREYGVQITFAPFKCEELLALLSRPHHEWQKLRLISRAFARRVEILRRVRDYDVVYLYHEAAILGPPVFERLIRRAGVPMVFDFDDAIFVPYTYVSPANGLLRLLKFPMKTRTICRLASHVITGNPYLADYARRVNERVTVVPATIDTDKYTSVTRETSADPPVIGWTGSYSTVQYLDLLGGALERLATRERFRLRVIGAPDFRLRGVEVEALPWDSRTEVSDLRPIDIGLMPLPNDRWTRGKCGLKALQYMALGIPSVCSTVGVNSSIIRDGVNGFLADTEDQWVEKLTQLLRSPPLRERLGAAGRATVEAEYSASVHVPRVYGILKSVVTDANWESGEAYATGREAAQRPASSAAAAAELRRGSSR